MCMGGGGSAGAELEQQEKRRSLAITNGMANINKVFSRFNPRFYQGVKQNTLDTLMPQAARQYRGARKQLGFNLGGKGLLNSSFAREAATDLEASRATAEQSVVGQANESVRDTQRQVQANKIDVTNQLVTSQDPNLAAQQAISASASIHAPSAIAPLGNLFATFANTYLATSLAKTYNEPAEPRISFASVGSNRIQK